MKVERVIEMNRARQKELWGVSIGYNLRYQSTVVTLKLHPSKHLVSKNTNVYAMIKNNNPLFDDTLFDQQRPWTPARPGNSGAQQPWLEGWPEVLSTATQSIAKKR